MICWFANKYFHKWVSVFYHSGYGCHAFIVVYDVHKWVTSIDTIKSLGFNVMCLMMFRKSVMSLMYFCPLGRHCLRCLSTYAVIFSLTKPILFTTGLPDLFGLCFGKHVVGWCTWVLSNKVAFSSFINDVESPCCLTIWIICLLKTLVWSLNNSS